MCFHTHIKIYVCVCFLKELMCMFAFPICIACKINSHTNKNHELKLRFDFHKTYELHIKTFKNKYVLIKYI